MPRFAHERVEFDRVSTLKFDLLLTAWKRFRDHDALDAFIAADEQRDWLDDYALFMTLKERAKPELLKASRKRRIAAGAGVQVQEVNRLLSQFEQSL